MTEARYRLTFLGCGSSHGVPRIGNDWGACDPQEPRNRRLRSSLMIERIAGRGVTRVIVDTGPDFREQVLRANVGTADAIVYTHAHADHIHGIDELRQFFFNRGHHVPVWAGLSSWSLSLSVHLGPPNRGRSPARMKVSWCP